MSDNDPVNDGDHLATSNQTVDLPHYVGVAQAAGNGCKLSPPTQPAERAAKSSINTGRKNITCVGDEDNVLPSIGSASHASGNCRPCAFVRHTKGCQNGAECQFCHLCNFDMTVEKRRRRKEREATITDRRTLARQRKGSRSSSADGRFTKGVSSGVKKASKADGRRGDGRRGNSQGWGAAGLAVTAAGRGRGPSGLTEHGGHGRRIWAVTSTTPWRWSRSGN